MANTRHKNGNWNLPTNAETGAIKDWDSVKIAVLMDIRDDLQDLNRLLRCENFLGMPHQLKKIRIAVEAKRREERATKMKKA